MSSNRRALWILAAVFALALPLAAQTPTVVSGQAKDVNGIPYAFAKVSANLVGCAPAGCTITVGGIPVQIGGQVNATADVNGNFNMNLYCNTAGGGCSVISPASTQWAFTINETGTPPPVGTGPQVCSASLTITGASQSISSSFAGCPALSNVVGGVPGGSSTYVQYNNGSGGFAGDAGFVYNGSGFVGIYNGSGTEHLDIMTSVGSGANSGILRLTDNGTNQVCFGHASVTDFCFFASNTPSQFYITGASTHFGFNGGKGQHFDTQAANNDLAGVATCSSSTVTVTFTTAYTSTPVIVISDETTKGGANVSAKSASSFTISCTGATDVVDYVVHGNPN